MRHDSVAVYGIAEANALLRTSVFSKMLRAPSGLAYFPTFYLQPALWAAFLRRFAAQGGILAPLFPSS
jgi:hypothetical protein